VYKPQFFTFINWNGGSSMPGSVLNSRFFYETTEYWPAARKISSMCPAKGVLGVHLVNWQCWFFFHIFYIQCTLFDCCIFNYEIMAATLTNPFLFILRRGSALADLGGVVDSRYTWSQLISVCNRERIIKIGQYMPKLCSNEKLSGFFWLAVYSSV